MNVEDLNQNLFVKGSMEKVATYEMSQDVTEWDEDVIKHLHEEYPELTEQDIEVVFKKTDAKKGYGYGFIAMGKDGMIKIPLIIKEYQLYPLDVMLFEGKAYPLTADTVKGIVQKTAIGKAVKKKTPNDVLVGPNISSRVYPGFFGQTYGRGFSGYKTASVKDESILEGIGITEKQAAEFKAKMEQNEELVAAWANSPCKDVLKKIGAAMTAEQPKAANPKAIKNLDPDEVKPDQAHPLVAAFIKKDDVGADKMQVAKYGYYTVEGLSGVKYRGCVFPGVYDFNLQPVGVTIFSGGKLVEDGGGAPYVSGRYGSVQGKIAGVPCPDLSGSERPGGFYASKGDHGCFCLEKGPVAMAFIPVKVLSKSTIRENRTMYFDKSNQHVELKKDFDIKKLLVQDGMGTVYRVVISPLVADVKVINGIVMMPASVKWVDLGTLVKLKEDPAQMKKVAAGYSVTMRHLGGDSFSIEAPWAENWAKEGELRNRVRGYLGQYYTDETIDPLFDEAVKSGRVHFNDRAPMPDVEEPQWPDAHKIARDLTKVASALPNPELVDTVLSLQFINKDNVGKFVGYLPQLEKVSTQLADLLIGARLGLEVEEYPIKSAMENLTEVIDDLKLMRGK